MSALDELAYGPSRTLNLREGLPSAELAVGRVDRWLRDHQVRGDRDVLIITGRGSHSHDGIAVLKPAVEKLLASLRRQGVVQSYSEHNPGALAVRLAPIRMLVDAIPRQRHATPALPVVELHGISPTCITLLRQLAERSLDALGVRQDDGRIEDEMHRQLRVIVPALAGMGSLDDELQAVLRRAIAEYD